MLLLVKVLDSIARVLVLTELCLVYVGIEFRLIIPCLPPQYIHCQTRSMISCLSNEADELKLTIINSIGRDIHLTTSITDKTGHSGIRSNLRCDTTLDE